MKRPDKSVENKPSSTTEKKIVNYIEALVEFTNDLVDKHELQPYINREEIDTDRVDESEDITPAQVAILGGWAMARRMKEAVSAIQAGRSVEAPKVSRPNTGIIAGSIDKRTGKVEMIGGDNIPPEVLEQLKNFINEMENEDE